MYYVIRDKKGYFNFWGKEPPFPKKWSNVHPKQFPYIFWDRNWKSTKKQSIVIDNFQKISIVIDRKKYWYSASLLGLLYTSRISHFVDMSQKFLWNTLGNTKHPLYTFHISFKFCVREKINYEILLTFCENVTPGAKWCKMWKKVWQNTLPYTFCFSHFASISCYFVKCVQLALENEWLRK